MITYNALGSKPQSPTSTDVAKANGKYDVSAYSIVSADAEWDYTITTGDDIATRYLVASPLTLQLVFRNDEGFAAFYLISPDLPLPDIDAVTERLGYTPIVIQHDFQQPALTHFLLPVTLSYQIFYAVNDFRFFVGDARLKELLVNGDITSKRRITCDSFTTTGTRKGTLDDLVGIANSSLDGWFNRVGVVDEFKSLPFDLGYNKGNMAAFAAGHPDEFCCYAMSDAMLLHPALVATVEQLNTVVSTAVPGFTPYTTSNLPRTTGKLVSDIFERWLHCTYPALFKTLLLLSSATYGKEYKKLNQLKAQVEALEPTDADIWKMHKAIANGGFTKAKNNPYIHGLGAASVRAFHPENYAAGTVVFNGVVHGGRCVNEKPEATLIHNVLDIDLSSCYGTALRNFDYYCGLPTVYAKLGEDKPVTLGKFLKKYESQLVPGAYTITVSGKLRFDQDLIFSKTKLTPVTIKSKLFGNFDAGEDGVDATHLGGEFKLLRREIVNGVITHDVLNTMRRVATPSELTQWMNLEVVTAAWYPAHLELSIDEFCKYHSTQKQRGFHRSPSEGGDTRSRHWCRIGLEGFVGKLIDTRKHFKALSKSAETAEERHQYKLLQESVKLLVNTVYGCLASPYFPMGHTIVANNITAKARVGVWMMAKALNTVQSITDGGMYSADNVFRLKTHGKDFRLPGFNRLYSKDSTVKRNDSRRWGDDVESIQLFDASVFTEIKSCLSGGDAGDVERIQTHIDNTATAHINSFWSAYGMELPFAVEHKLANTGYSAGYINSGDYAINTVTGNVVTKVRGAKEANHPKKLLVQALANGEAYTQESPFEVEESIKVNAWLKDAGCKKSRFLPAGVMPGDVLIRNYTITPKDDDERFLQATEDDVDRIDARKRQRHCRKA